VSGTLARPLAEVAGGRTWAEIRSEVPPC
jgi:hypothetical protein